MVATLLSRSLRRARSISHTRAPQCSIARPPRDTRTPRRAFATTPAPGLPPVAPPKDRSRGPVSDEATQTDFGSMDIFHGTPPPSTGVDVCYPDGFLLNSGLKISGSGTLLVGGEAFRWSPWVAAGGADGGTGRDHIFTSRGQLELVEEVWGVLSVVWPKPDLLILGTGRDIVPITAATRRVLNGMGLRVEVQDTRNAAAQFSLLATERGVQQVAAALLPMGHRRGGSS